MSKYIAVTGGIGSGKSTAIECIEQMGYPVFSCDRLYAELLSEKEYIEAVGSIFKGVVTDGRIDKRALAAIVFEDEKAREKLNALAHPIVMSRLHEKMRGCNSPLVAAEVPLLFEGNFQEDFDGIIVIVRDVSDRIEAIRQRDGGTVSEALAKIRSQFDYDAKENIQKLKTNKIQLVSNDDSVEKLKVQIENSIRFFLER